MRALLLVLVACGSSPGANNVGDDTPDGDASPMPAIDARVYNWAMVYVVGDSIAAGYNAANNNAAGGGGYARLVYEGIRAKHPAATFRDLAESGANSDEAAARVRNANMPAASGDVLVLLNVGGNDFNDSIQTMVNASATAQAATRLRTNLADMVGRFRAKYTSATFAIDTIHDPTDGMGTVPPQFDDGFCGTLQNPLFTPQLRMQAITNLATMNAAITAETAAQNATLVDVHGVFMGHGMNGGNARWLSNDCAHPTTDGHSHLRDAVRASLTL